jgi:hypothetical protein
MKLKQQLAVTVASFALSFVVAGVPSIASFSSGENSLIYNTAHNKTVAQLKISQLMFANAEIDQSKSILCSISKPSLFDNWINLFARLLLISSFGYFGATRYSSAFERYLQVISRDFLVIVIKAFLLLSLIGLGIVVISISLFPHPITSNSNCTSSDFGF